MKTILLVLMLAASCQSIYSQACCCSSAGGNYSVLPEMDSHVVGMRYTFSSFNATTYPSMNMNMSGMDMTMLGPGVPTTENMNTLDVFARVALPKRFFISVFLPVHILNERTQGSSNTLAGLGDVSALLQYAVFNTKKCTGKESKHQLKLGVGVKAPTGKFSMTPDGMYSTDLQLGTGSVDFLFNAVYTYRYKKFGINATAAYKKNLVNADGFRFGDNIKTSIEPFYLFKLPHQLSIMPKGGVSYEYLFYNNYNKQALNYTGGQYLFAKAGLEVYYKSMAFSASVSPVLLSISNWSGEPYELFSIETGVYYSFSNVISHKKVKQK